MGIDFIRSKRQKHIKAWSRQFYSHAVDLFSGAAATTKQVIRAVTVEGQVLHSGDEVLIRRGADGRVVVSKDICNVAIVPRPSRDLTQALDVFDGVMQGRVYQCFNDAGVTDIEYRG